MVSMCGGGVRGEVEPFLGAMFSKRFHSFHKQVGFEAQARVNGRGLAIVGSNILHEDVRLEFFGLLTLW